MEFGEFVPVYFSLFVMADIKEILINKRVLKASVTKLKDKIVNCISDADFTQVELFEVKIIKLNTELHEIFQIIFSHSEEKDIDTYVEEH